MGVPGAIAARAAGLVASATHFERFEPQRHGTGRVRRLQGLGKRHIHSYECTVTVDTGVQTADLIMGFASLGTTH